MNFLQQLTVTLIMLSILTMGTLAAYADENKDVPVDFSADSLVHDEVNQVIIAKGDVELIREGRIMQADEMRYDLKNDVVEASGNVVFTDENGDIHFADEVRLEEKLKKGFVSGMQTYLKDGGRFAAAEGERIRDGEVIVMHDVKYTPCECGGKGEDEAWQIKAEKVTYDTEEKRIVYDKARFEIFGVPVMYLPKLSHPDGTVERKSGFLTPSFGFNSELGATVISNYYWDLGPDRDATFGLMVTSEEVPVALGEYRQRFNNAEISMEGSTTYSGRIDDIAGKKVNQNEEFRGHLFAEGLWDINNKWRSGIDVEFVTDDQYLRQYDFSNDNILENQIYVERFSGRNYASGRLISFQDVRIKDLQSDQPNILPEIEISMVGEPNNLLGGRWGMDLSMLGLQRDSGQDLNRVSFDAGWIRRDITSFGLLGTMKMDLRGDAYQSSDRDIATVGSGRSTDSTQLRIQPQAQAMVSYPLVKPLENSQIVVEPQVSVAASPNIDSENDNIPNEDSQDVQIDVSNIFEADRFSGRDRLEDRIRTTYGVRSGIYGHSGSYLNSFVGQSYRFENKDNPFPEGSGLSEQSSDIVGQLSGAYLDRYRFDYRFQLGEDDWSSKRHEFDGYSKWGRYELGARYFYSKALEGTDLLDSREQLEGGAGVFLTDSWRMRGTALYDLGQSRGLRKSTIGIDYFGCCLFFALTGERNLTDDASGEASTEIKFRLGLKGLGEFETPNASTWDVTNVR